MKKLLTIALFLLSSGLEAQQLQLIHGRPPAGGGGGCAETDWTAASCPGGCITSLHDLESGSDEGDDAYPSNVTDNDYTTDRGTPPFFTTSNVFRGTNSIDGNVGHKSGTIDSGQPHRDSDRDYTIGIMFRPDATTANDWIWDKGGAERVRNNAGQLQKDDTGTGIVNITNCSGVGAGEWWMVAAVFDHNGTNFDVTYYCMETGPSNSIITGQTQSGISGSTAGLMGFCGVRNGTDSFDGLCDDFFVIDQALTSGELEGIGQCSLDGDGI